MEGNLYWVLHLQTYTTTEGQKVPIPQNTLIYTGKKKASDGEPTTSNLFTVDGGSGWSVYNNPNNPTKSLIIAKELLEKCKEELGLSSQHVKIFTETKV